MPPIELDYQKPLEPPPFNPRWWLFSAGVIAGWALLAFDIMGTPSRFLMRYVYWLVPIPPEWMMGALQFIGAVTLCFFKRWRPFAIGLIVSFPLAALIFYGTLAIVCGLMGN